MLKNPTRAERKLPPYVSPKKAWDQPIEVPIEWLVQVEPSSRKWRRLRRADSAANGRKSRRNAARGAFNQRQLVANLLGVARVYLRGTGTDAMRRNVTTSVHRWAEERSKDMGQDFTTSLKEIEGRLLDILIKADGRND